MVARRGTEEENGHAEGGKEIAQWERWCVMLGRWYGWTAADWGRGCDYGQNYKKRNNSRLNVAEGAHTYNSTIGDNNAFIPLK